MAASQALHRTASDNQLPDRHGVQISPVSSQIVQIRLGPQQHSVMQPGQVALLQGRVAAGNQSVLKVQPRPPQRPESVRFVSRPLTPALQQPEKPHSSNTLRTRDTENESVWSETQRRRTRMILERIPEEEERGWCGCCDNPDLPLDYGRSW